MKKQKVFLLAEADKPTQWYNIIPDMPNKPQSMIHPGTKEPITEADLSPLFSTEAAKQELNVTDSFIDIPQPILEKYDMYRSTPLVRAYELEKALGTPAHIYFKNESVSPVGSHKLNSALPQAYYCMLDGVKNITTETGAGQWGTALARASKAFGLNLTVFMVKSSCTLKPYRKTMMQTWGADVIPSPSAETQAGRKVLEQTPMHDGSLGIAISEAVEMAINTDNCKYALGSVLNHVSLHQTIIGLEAEKQMEMAGEYPDIVIGCFGGGSNFSGLSFPFLKNNFKNGKKTRFIAAEPASCPKFTKGTFEYDFGDESGYTPLIPMYTLGHNFAPASIHAGGLRYHGAGATVSQLFKDGYIEALDIQQIESFEAGVLFAQTEGIVPAPESCHAIAATISEALKAKEEGTEKTILFNLSGHGFLDMTAYDMYLSGNLQNYEYKKQ